MRHRAKDGYAGITSMSQVSLPNNLNNLNISSWHVPYHIYLSVQ